jgi:HK97 family phage portal protein
MGARDVMARSLRLVLRAVEGAYRPGPYYLPISGGWLPDGAPTNWWQLGWNVYSPESRSAMVEACVSAYAQTIAMCPGAHWRLNSKKGRDRVKNSALARILRYPNSYQSPSDFILNAVRSLYMDGNCYALALRNDRFEIDELHLMNPQISRPRIATTGDIFYQLGGNAIIDARLGYDPLLVPARDVLHIRLHAMRRNTYPLIGESPILHAADDIAAGSAMLQQQIAFYLNQARPSAVLTTDLVLDKDQVQSLRDRWDEQTKGLNQGKTPILTAGLKPQPWGMSPRDAELAEIMKLNEQHIALAFRIPLQIFGLGGGGTGATGYNSTEALMHAWIASGLGFALKHIEDALGVLFNLKGLPDEFVQFDTAALLRSAMKDRIEALSRGVISGIYSPNEARETEGLDHVPFGEEPRVQQQVVPLSQVGKIPEAPAPHAPTAAPPPPQAPPQKVSSDVIDREVRKLFASADRWGRG